MNLVNRMIVVLLALSLLALSALVLTVATGWVLPEQLLREPWSQVLAPAVLARGADWRWLVGVSAILIPLSFVLFVLELTTLRPPRRGVTVSSGAGGEVSVSLRSVRELADRIGGEHPSVREIRTRVRERRDGIEVVGEVSVDPAHPLPQVAEELQTRIKQSLEGLVGLSVAAVRVHAQIGPLARPGEPPPRVH